MSYSKYGDTGTTPIQDLISSAFLGLILGVTLFAIFEQTGTIDYVLRKLDLSDLRGRIGITQFGIFGALFGVVLDFLGKLFAGGKRGLRRR